MRMLGWALVLVLGLVACERTERPPMPKTGESAQGEGQHPTKGDGER